MNLRSLTFAYSLALALATASQAALELAAPFADRMILQREVTVPVWGLDQPGAKVTVEFAGQSHEAIADPRGEWRISLDPLKASSDGSVFKVGSSTGSSIEIKDVLVGEVWHASGQSNMEWQAGKSMCAELAREMAGAKEELPIREYRTETVSALYPQKRATSADGWKSSRSAGQFSALALSFAHTLHQELQVPIGILLTSHSNTRIEAFTERGAIEAHPLLAGDATLIHDADVLTDQGRAAFEKYAADLLAWQWEAAARSQAGGAIPPRPNLPGIAGMWRGPSQFFNGKIHPIIPYAIRGSIWCQGTSNSDDGKIYAARMEALVRGWRKAWNMPDMPFYFTQMQCYGGPDPDNVGFADIRQAQHLFFVNNRDHVGMVVQTDLNPARPQGIHYSEKLHPGMRLARWALANDYDKDIAFTGPIYSGYAVKGGEVTVSFEKESLFGGLMVGSKGMAADSGTPGKYVEPAQPTPGEPLNHFRLCGKDHVWHAAEARIVNDTVVVRSGKVPEPVGVQYAYSAVPMHSNLYNKAGLPATPFAAIDGELIFQPAKAGRSAGSSEIRPFLQLVEYLRDGAVIQRNQEIPVWGHANAGATVMVTLGDKIFTTKANDMEQWSLKLPPLPVNTKGLDLTVETSLGAKRTVRNILFGDVWFLTGASELTGEMAWNARDKDAAAPEPMPLVREFRRKTKASTNATPRKRYFETGGGKYRSFWQAADFANKEDGVTMFAYHFAKTLNRPGIPQGFITMSSGSSGRSAQFATPLSWTSFDGVKDIENPAFKARLDELLLQYPQSRIAREALKKHLAEVKATARKIIDLGQRGADLSSEAPLAFPAFPEAGKNSGVSYDMIPTYAYNWCVSPFTPMAVSGVIWVPAAANIGPAGTHYADELEIYARSLPGTYGQEKVPFLFAQPDASLLDGLTQPDIAGAGMVRFDQWPKSLADLAVEMARQVK
jgi:sialate O-acetylesterase